ncbi:hypothetical protein, partial [Candidatus Magnetobacterium casense]
LQWAITAANSLSVSASERSTTPCLCYHMGMDFMQIVTAVKEIGLVPVVVILLILLHFRHVSRLEKQNEKLINTLFKILEENKHGLKNDSRRNPPHNIRSGSLPDREENKQDRQTD